MQTTHIFTLLGLLALFYCFSGVTSLAHHKDECSDFSEPTKGQLTACTLQHDPVCGSDGVTYGNLCSFCAAKRKSGNKITLNHTGACKPKDECSGFPAPIKGQLTACTREYFPVCGSNGVTYSNICTFCAAKRESGNTITIEHQDVCKAKDICKRFPEPIKGCTKEFHQVCGTDGVTYDNKCLLCLERQETGEDIDFKHEGECEKRKV